MKLNNSVRKELMLTLNYFMLNSARQQTQIVKEFHKYSKDLYFENDQVCILLSVPDIKYTEEVEATIIETQFQQSLTYNVVVDKERLIVENICPKFIRLIKRFVQDKEIQLYIDKYFAFCNKRNSWISNCQVNKDNCYKSTDCITFDTYLQTVLMKTEPKNDKKMKQITLDQMGLKKRSRENKEKKKAPPISEKEIEQLPAYIRQQVKEQIEKPFVGIKKGEITPKKKSELERSLLKTNEKPLEKFLKRSPENLNLKSDNLNYPKLDVLPHGLTADVVTIAEFLCAFKEMLFIDSNINLSAECLAYSLQNSYSEHIASILMALCYPLFGLGLVEHSSFMRINLKDLPLNIYTVFQICHLLCVNEFIKHSFFNNFTFKIPSNSLNYNDRNRIVVFILKIIYKLLETPKFADKIEQNVLEQNRINKLEINEAKKIADINRANKSKSSFKSKFVCDKLKTMQNNISELKFKADSVGSSCRIIPLGKDTKSRVYYCLQSFSGIFVSYSTSHSTKYGCFNNSDDIKSICNDTSSKNVDFLNLKSELAYRCDKLVEKTNSQNIKQYFENLSLNDKSAWIMRGFKEEISILHEKLYQETTFVNFNQQEWKDCVENGNDVSVYAKLMVKLQEAVPNNFYKYHLIGNATFSNWHKKWKKLVLECSNFWSLHFLMGLFECSINWKATIKNSRCQKCNRSRYFGDMTICSDCSNVYHIKCLKNFTEEYWKCDDCNINLWDAKKDSSDEISNEILQICNVCNCDNLKFDVVKCSECSTNYHLDCHSPPLRYCPRTRWICHLCKGYSVQKRSRQLSLSFSDTEESSTGFTNHSQNKKKLVKLRTSKTRRVNLTDSESEDVNFSELYNHRKSLRSGNLQQGDYAKFYNSDSHSRSDYESEKDDVSFHSNGSVYINKVDSSDDINTIDNYFEKEYTSDTKESIHLSLDFNHDSIQRTISCLFKNRNIWPFQEPVNGKEVPDYYDVIKDPIDLFTISKKFKSHKYTNNQQFFDDLNLMLENAKYYNKPNSPVWCCITPIKNSINKCISTHFKKYKINFSK